MKSIRDHVDPEDKKTVRIGAKPKQNVRPLIQT